MRGWYADAVVALRALAFVAGFLLVAATVLSAVQTFVVPRALPVRLSRLVFVSSRSFFSTLARRRTDYQGRDRIMAFYAPLTLLVLPAVWLTLILLGYSAMYWGLGEDAWHAVAVSGSSLLTLGFDRPTGRVATLMSVSEAGLGIALLALLITYLPTIYGAFAQRETFVALLEGRAGTPPWGVTMLERYERIGLHRSNDLWRQGETWFAQLAESHTSLASLPFFRSPQPELSWVTAAGTVLDAASMQLAALDLEFSPEAALCVRSGFVSLRRIADYFGIPYDPDPRPTDPISIAREEFDAACDRLARAGAPVNADRDQAWRDFSGWRVNYDAVLLALAGLTEAAPAPWTSDRAPAYKRPRIRHRKQRPAAG
jgi:hypothetical protein